MRNSLYVLYVCVSYSLDQGSADFFCRVPDNILGLVSHLLSLLNILFCLFFYNRRIWPVSLVC